MKKEINNLSCPICNSSNVYIQAKHTSQEETEQHNQATRIKPIIYDCHCLDCNHTYELNCGYEVQTICAQPTPINNLKDIKLLTTYKSDSPLDRNYKIISIEKPYESNDNHTYLLFPEGEEFPILLNEETLPEMIEEPPKVLSLIKKTCDTREQIKL